MRQKQNAQAKPMHANGAAQRHRPDRLGKKAVVVHTERATADELKILAIRNNVTNDIMLHFCLAAGLTAFEQKLPTPLRERLLQAGLLKRLPKASQLKPA